MSQAKSKVRENGTSVRLYTDNSKQEVANALTEMEAERAQADKDLLDLLHDADQFDDYAA